MTFSPTTGAITPGLPFAAQPAPVVGATDPAPDQSSLMAMVTALSQVMAIFASMQAGTMVQPAVAGGGAAAQGLGGVMPQAGDGLVQLIAPGSTTFGGGATLGAGSPVAPGTNTIGGGGPVAGGVTTILNTPSTGLGGALPSYFSVSAPTTVLGGGGGAGVAASTSLGGAAISYFSVVDPTTGAAGQAAPAPGTAAPTTIAPQPAAPQAMAATAGGGAAATPGEPTTLGQWGGNLDPQYVQGTPQPGGLIDQLLKTASATAMPAMNEGTWMWLSDASGARIMAHVHGQWAQHPEQIQAAIAAGRIMVHYHGDTGTLHLHDVM